MAKERIGYVGKNKQGKWFARVTLTNKNGKRRNIVRVGKDKSEAKQILKRLIREIDNADRDFVDTSQIDFGNLADFYQTHYLKPAEFIGERKVAGLRDWKHPAAFLRVFREYFGKMRLKEITYSDLVSLRARRLATPTQFKKQRSVTTVNRELTFLRRLFNIAIQENWISKNPFSCGESLIKTSLERKREKILTVEEETRLLAACNHPRRKHLKPLLIALLDTGARKGEMIKLKWSDVDFNNRLIIIRAMNSKTLKGRYLAITQRLLAELLLLWQQSDRQQDSLVFGVGDNVRKSFSSACKEAGIKEGGIDGLTLHCLRHTAATRLVKGQLPIQMVGRILGHTQTQTTYRYLSANEETLYQASEILESYQSPK